MATDNDSGTEISETAQIAQAAVAPHLEDGLAAGGAGLRLLSLEGAVPVEGGIPLVVGGKIVGAIGASGGTSEQDGVVAAAAVAQLK